MIRIFKETKPPWHVTYDDETMEDGRALASFEKEEEARAFAEVKTKWGKNARVTHFDFGGGLTIQFYWPW
jgi:hypothetical protein